MNAERTAHLAAKTTMFYNGQVFKALLLVAPIKDKTQKFTFTVFELVSTPQFTAVKINGMSNRTKKLIRPALEKIIAETGNIFKLDLSGFASENKIILKVNPERKKQAEQYLDAYTDETQKIEDAQAANAQNAKVDDAAPPAPQKSEDFNVDRRSWQRLLTDSLIFRGKTYTSLNYPSNAKAKTKVKGGEPFTMTLLNMADAESMIRFLHHIKCEEIGYGRTKLVVHGTLEPGVDYEKKFDDTCLTFFPTGSKPDQKQLEVKPIPGDPTIAAYATLINGLNASDQDMLMSAIILKNKKSVISKEDIEIAFVKKLIKHFASKGYVIMGKDETVGNGLSVKKGKVRFEYVFTQILPVQAFDFKFSESQEEEVK